MDFIKMNSANTNVRDWKKCFICQKDDGKLNQVNKSDDQYLLNCYSQHIDNVVKLQELGELPDWMFIDELISNYYRDACVKVMLNDDHPQVVWHRYIVSIY